MIKTTVEQPLPLAFFFSFFANKNTIFTYYKRDKQIFKTKMR